jgi:glycogen(starch) synthase
VPEANTRTTVPSISVIICTRNRAKSLELTLESLQHLNYPRFEVVAVQGPCTDRTSEVLDAYRGQIKSVATTEPNVSLSCNLGLQAATGELVAFIDDDAIPDPMWLDNLADPFDDCEVAATGGPVFDHTGYHLQLMYCLADRWGDHCIEYEPRRLDYLDHPSTWIFPFLMRTNSVFRRQALVDLGGFDENYVFYLEETDICLRLIESGYRVVPLERGHVYHGFLPSERRNADRITLDRFHVLLSRLYFAIKNGLPSSDEAEMAAAFARFARLHRADLAGHVAEGRAPADTLERFRDDLSRAWWEAHQRALGPRHIHDTEWFDGGSGSFLPFPTIECSGPRLRHCILTGEYPPAGGDLGRACHSLATGLASTGQIVHVITGTSAGHSTVDFQDGVWVHRIVAAGLSPHASAWALAARDELERIHAVMPVDAVQIPNGDAADLSALLDGRWPLYSGADTPMMSVAGIPADGSDPS